MMVLYPQVAGPGRDVRFDVAPEVKFTRNMFTVMCSTQEGNDQSAWSQAY